MTKLVDPATGLVRVGAGEGPAYWLAGDTYTVKTSAGSTGGVLGLVEASIPPGSGPPPHCHSREDETFYLLSGSLEIRGDDDIVLAAAGDVVFLPSGTVHSFRNIGVDAARALIIITPAGFEGFFVDAGAPAESGVSAPPPGPAELARVVAVAPGYGVELTAPHRS
jgi:quercetin dioxygenase-like cupin family protein